MIEANPTWRARVAGAVREALVAEDPMGFGDWAIEHDEYSIEIDELTERIVAERSCGERALVEQVTACFERCFGPGSITRREARRIAWRLRFDLWGGPG